MNSLSINLINLNINKMSSEKKKREWCRMSLISIIWRERWRHLMLREASYMTGLRSVFARAPCTQIGSGTFYHGPWLRKCGPAV